MSEQSLFDASTARQCKVKPGGSPHRVLRDEAGCLSMACRSESAERGVAVSKAGLDWLREQEAPARFIRVINPNSRLDRTFRLEDMSAVELREAARPYYMLDPEDFDADEGYRPFVASASAERPCT